MSIATPQQDFHQFARNLLIEVHTFAAQLSSSTQPTEDVADICRFGDTLISRPRLQRWENSGLAAPALPPPSPASFLSSWMGVHLLRMTEPPEPESSVERTCANPGRGLYLAATWQALCKVLQLSPRELEITQAVFDDLSEPAMAEKLDISVHTVHTYLKRLYLKLGARSRVEVVCIVVAAERAL